MSETALAKIHLEKYIIGDFILDVGFGGSACHPKAITLDMPVGYCPSLEGHRQVLRGDCKNMPFICDNAFDTLWNSHIIEDHTFEVQAQILREWWRILRPGGHLITVAPDEAVYSAHCRNTGQPYNLAHVEPTMGLIAFKKQVVSKTGPWEHVHENPLIDTYSFHLVLRKPQ
jgi:SAM-dependent methyltransferase